MSVSLICHCQRNILEVSVVRRTQNENATRHQQLEHVAHKRARVVQVLDNFQADCNVKGISSEDRNQITSDVGYAEVNIRETRPRIVNAGL
jgi:hypothetical protein